MKPLSISLVLLPIILAEEYLIDRQVLLIKNSWTDQPDSFMLPSSMCSGDIAANCSAMGGTRIESKCGCSCNKRNEFEELYQSTFGFYENQWKCYENKKVRAQSGCQTIMNLRQDTIHLMILPMAKPEVAHRVPDLTSNCDIKGGKYLECDGKWNQINTSLVKSRFYLDRDTDNHHYLQYSTSQPSTPTINGRVIRLEIECTQPKKTQCILFKVKGQLKCGLVVTPTSPPLNIWTTNSNDSKATELEQATGYPTVTEHFNGTSNAAGSHGDSRAGMIAGAFAGVIGLFIIVIAIILLSRRRKKRYPVPRRSSFVVENESYGFGVDSSLRFVVPGRVSKDENEYSYSTNGSGGDGRSLELSSYKGNEGEDKVSTNIQAAKRKSNLYTKRLSAIHDEELKRAIQSRLRNGGANNPGYEDSEGTSNLPTSSMQPTYDLPYEHGRRQIEVRPTPLNALGNTNERIYDEPHAPPKTANPTRTLPSNHGVYQQLDPRKTSEYQTLGFKNETDA